MKNTKTTRDGKKEGEEETMNNAQLRGMRKMAEIVAKKEEKTMTRITGGARGYRAACTDALYGTGREMHNPVVMWNANGGFEVASGLGLNLNEGEVLIWEANFSANDGKPYGRPSYAEVREEISRALTDRRHEGEIACLECGWLSGHHDVDCSEYVVPD